MYHHTDVMQITSKEKNIEINIFQLKVVYPVRQLQ